MRVFQLLLAVTVLTQVPQEAAGQTPSQLTPEDSATLRVQMLQVLVDSLGPDERPPRIWIIQHADREAVAGPMGLTRLTAAERTAILKAFPTVEFAEHTDSLFLCPAGVHVSMPGTGCPIRDEGVIVYPGSLRLDGDSLRARSTLIQSGEADSGAYTWAQGAEVVFTRMQATWRTRGIRLLWIT